VEFGIGRFLEGDENIGISSFQKYPEEKILKTAPVCDRNDA
jgi:hypothetical protein